MILISLGSTLGAAQLRKLAIRMVPAITISGQ